MQARSTPLPSTVCPSPLSLNTLFPCCNVPAGSLVFEPATVTVKAGETIKFVNNAGFPHNVVFDEDTVPVSGKCAHKQKLTNRRLHGCVVGRRNRLLGDGSDTSARLTYALPNRALLRAASTRRLQEL